MKLLLIAFGKPLFAASAILLPAGYSNDVLIGAEAGAVIGGELQVLPLAQDAEEQVLPLPAPEEAPAPVPVPAPEEEDN